MYEVNTRHWSIPIRCEGDLGLKCEVANSCIQCRGSQALTGRMRYNADCLSKAVWPKVQRGARRDVFVTTYQEQILGHFFSFLMSYVGMIVKWVARFF